MALHDSSGDALQRIAVPGIVQKLQLLETAVFTHFHLSVDSSSVLSDSIFSGTEYGQSGESLWPGGNCRISQPWDFYELGS